MDGSYQRANPDDEEYLNGMIRGEIQYVPEDAGEDAGKDPGEDPGEDEDPSSFLNPSGEGMEIEMFDEGQTNNDDEGQTNIDGEVYIYIEPLVTRCIK